MERRDFLKTAALAPIQASLSGPVTLQTRARPNILLILGDNQQLATVGNRSQCQTPNLNRLAAQGIEFTRAYTTAAVCSPARNALLTGSFNWHFGTYNQVESPSSISNDPYPNVVTYGQRIREAGYQLGYNGKWHTSGSRSPLDFGYQLIGGPHRYSKELVSRLGLPTVSSRCTKSPMRLVSWPGSKPFGLWGYTECEEEETNWHQVAQAGIDMMKRFAARSQPWLVEIHFPEGSRAWPLRKYRQRYDARESTWQEAFMTHSRESLECSGAKPSPTARCRTQTTRRDVRSTMHHLKSSMLR